MTDCGITTILEGLGYHAFRGPRPVAWDQNLIILMLTGNAKLCIYMLIFPYHPPIPCEWVGIIIYLYHPHRVGEKVVL